MYDKHRFWKFLSCEVRKRQRVRKRYSMRMADAGVRVGQMLNGNVAMHEYINTIFRSVYFALSLSLSLSLSPLFSRFVLCTINQSNKLNSHEWEKYLCANVIYVVARPVASLYSQFYIRFSWLSIVTIQMVGASASAHTLAIRDSIFWWISQILHIHFGTLCSSAPRLIEFSSVAVFYYYFCFAIGYSAFFPFFRSFPKWIQYVI